MKKDYIRYEEMAFIPKPEKFALLLWHAKKKGIKLEAVALIPEGVEEDFDKFLINNDILADVDSDIVGENNEQE